MPLERRKNARAAVSQGALPAATVELTKPFFHEPFEVEVHNFSSGGMKLFSRETIPLYYEFDLDLGLPDNAVVRGKAKAVYQIASEDGFEVGISFSALEDPAARMFGGMAEDHIACEERIRKEESGVCRSSCRFLALCSKPQKGH